MSVTTTKSGTKSGVFALIGKVGVKFVEVAPKLFKILKVGKVALTGASAVAYSLLWTWQFALVIIVMLVLHEYGHLWMMRRFDMKTKGMYLIPFVGAAAVAEEDFPSRRAEAIIAIAGPVVGFASAAVVGGMYLVTGTPFFAAVASWTALINLFNLLPVTPLDGGRIIKSISLSIGSKVGIAVMVCGLMLGVALAVWQSLYIFAIIIPIGLLDVWYERRKMKKDAKDAEFVSAITTALGGYSRSELKPAQPAMTKAGMVRAFVSYAGLAIALWVAMVLMASEPGAAVAMKALQG